MAVSGLFSREFDTTLFAFSREIGALFAGADLGRVTAEMRLLLLLLLLLLLCVTPCDDDDGPAAMSTRGSISFTNLFASLSLMAHDLPRDSLSHASRTCRELFASLSREFSNLQD